MRYIHYNATLNEQPVSYIKDTDNNQIVVIFNFGCQELNKLMAIKARNYLNGVDEKWNIEC